MMPITPEQFEQLLENGKPENRGADHCPVVMLYLARTDCCWLLTEIDNENHDLAFGLCDVGFGSPELGYVNLKEIQSVAASRMILPRQDEHFNMDYPISYYAKIANFRNRIVDDTELLKFLSTL